MKAGAQGRNEWLLMTVFVLLCVFRFSYLGFKYTPYLDDYVQYRLYPSFENRWETVLVGGISTIYTRPLASILDLYFWSNFYEIFSVAIVIIAILHGFSAWLLYRSLLSAHIKVSPLMLVFYALTPINIEGTYWISAASRIVVSVFFAALACFLMTKGKIFLFFAFNLISLCFYEQTAILSVALAVIICFCSRKKRLALIPAVNILLVMGYYLIFGSMADNAERLNIVSAKNFGAHFVEVTAVFGKVIADIIPRILLRGTARGIGRVARDSAYIWLTVLVIMLAVFLECICKKRYDGEKILLRLTVGTVLMLAPQLVFFVIDNSWVNMRNVATSLLGAAIILDAAVEKLFKRLAPALAVCTAFVFMIVSVSEVCDYKYTAEKDFEIVSKIAGELPKGDMDKPVFIEVDVKAPIYFAQNAPFNDHIMSVRGSKWGITGPVKAVSGRLNIDVEVKE